MEPSVPTRIRVSHSFPPRGVHGTPSHARTPSGGSGDTPFSYFHFPAGFHPPSSSNPTSPTLTASQSVPLPNSAICQTSPPLPPAKHFTPTPVSHNATPKGLDSTFIPVTSPASGTQMFCFVFLKHKAARLSPISDEEGLQSRRGELVESPTTRLNYKIFYRNFKQIEKEDGFKAAVAFATKHLAVLPKKVHWRVYLELADMAKRENMLEQARDYYMKVENITTSSCLIFFFQVTKLQPYASQGWLEYAKMEEECGQVESCRVWF